MAGAVRDRVDLDGPRCHMIAPLRFQSSHIPPTLSAREAADVHWQAVIIGAGPAGAAAALRLARRGLLSSSESERPPIARKHRPHWQPEITRAADPPPRVPAMALLK